MPRGGGPAAILLVPEGPILRGRYGPGASESFQARIDRMSRECGAPTFNAREWLADEYDFIDSHHLLRGR